MGSGTSKWPSEVKMGNNRQLEREFAIMGHGKVEIASGWKMEDESLRVRGYATEDERRSPNITEHRKRPRAEVKRQSRWICVVRIQSKGREILNEQACLDKMKVFECSCGR